MSCTHQMTAADVAFLKGEASAQPGDTAIMALQRVEECGMLDAPAAQRIAFVSGFLGQIVQPSKAGR